mgnify:CR=1 FL=1
MKVDWKCEYVENQHFLVEDSLMHDIIYLYSYDL